MPYPLISEYVEAIKAAEDNFEELKYLRPVLDDAGEPVIFLFPCYKEMIDEYPL